MNEFSVRAGRILRLAWKRISSTLERTVFGLDDSPRRIALGVFIGFVVSMTPTLGFQISIYLVLAVIFRANKVSGVPPLMISNPATAVPLYYANWRVGVWVMPGSSDAKAFQVLFPDTLPIEVAIGRWFTSEFWHTHASVVGRMMIELWVGCFVVGIILGVIAYLATLRILERRLRAVES